MFLLCSALLSADQFLYPEHYRNKFYILFTNKIIFDTHKWVWRSMSFRLSVFSLLRIILAVYTTCHISPIGKRIPYNLDGRVFLNPPKNLRFTIKNNVAVCLVCVRYLSVYQYFHQNEMIPKHETTVHLHRLCMNVDV